jgi:hypothetical protein
VACREIRPGVGVMLRNLGFVLRHALMAPRRARPCSRTRVARPRRPGCAA